MAVLTLCIAAVALGCSLLAIFLRKPGPQGEPGEKGDRGLPGEDGHDGIDGRDAKFKLESGHLYVTYVEEPTKESWIDLGKVQGPKGAKGNPGKDGKDAVVINAGTILTKEQVINLLSDGDEIVLTQPVIAPAFLQESHKK